jgi:branched-chain amino acid transport system permease protein
VAHRLMRGAWGQAFLVLRENPLACAATGLDGGRLRLAAFSLSALYAGAAGALYAHTLRVVSPESLDFRVMVLCLTMTVIGGQRRISGAILGGMLLVALPEWFRFLQGADLVAYGLVLLAVIIAAPDGAIGALEQIKNFLWPERSCEAVLPRAATAPPRRDNGPMSLLEISGLTKHFGGVTALAGVDLALAPGEILGLIGPNGSGKTTLINLVSGIDRADAGTIRLAGTPIGGLPAHEIARRGIARSFQTGTLVETMNSLDTVALAVLAARGELTFSDALTGWNGAFAPTQALGEAMRLLERLGIGAAALRACGDLPHGVRRRVEIARALALQPRFLLLDEPASGLAADEQRQLARQLGEIAQDGIGVLVIEHAMPFLLPVAHRVICLDHGRVIAAGTPDDIRRDGRVVAAYLGIEPEAPPSRV